MIPRRPGGGSMRSVLLAMAPDGTVLPCAAAAEIDATLGLLSLGWGIDALLLGLHALARLLAGGGGGGGAAAELVATALDPAAPGSLPDLWAGAQPCLAAAGLLWCRSRGGPAGLV